MRDRARPHGVCRRRASDLPEAALNAVAMALAPGPRAAGGPLNREFEGRTSLGSWLRRADGWWITSCRLPSPASMRRRNGPLVVLACCLLYGFAPRAQGGPYRDPCQAGYSMPMGIRLSDPFPSGGFWVEFFVPPGAGFAVSDLSFVLVPSDGGTSPGSATAQTASERTELVHPDGAAQEIRLLVDFYYAFDSSGAPAVAFLRPSPADVDRLRGRYVVQASPASVRRLDSRGVHAVSVMNSLLVSQTVVYETRGAEPPSETSAPADLPAGCVIHAGVAGHLLPSMSCEGGITGRVTSEQRSGLMLVEQQRSGTTEWEPFGVRLFVTGSSPRSETRCPWYYDRVNPTTRYRTWFVVMTDHGRLESATGPVETSVEGGSSWRVKGASPSKWPIQLPAADTGAPSTPIQELYR